MSRAQESANALKLQGFLGEGYKVEYDCCESCLTYFYYRNICYLIVPNEAMSGRISVWDYCAPTPLKMGYTTTQAQFYELFPERKKVWFPDRKTV